MENGSTSLGELEEVAGEGAGKDWNGSDKTMLLTADEENEATSELLGLIDGVGTTEDENETSLDTLETG